MVYVHDNYLDDYDYFWLGGDDFYLIVENLVNYLASIHKPDSEDPLLLGHQIPRGNTNFCGGGPGYVLNKMAVKKLIKEALPTCYVSYGYCLTFHFVTTSLYSHLSLIFLL